MSVVYVGRNVEGVILRFEGVFDAHSQANLVDRRKWPPRQLDALRARDVEVGILSGKPLTEARNQCVQVIGPRWDTLVRALAAGSPADASVSSLASSMRAVLAEMEVAPEKAAIVSPHDPDLTAAAQLGMVTIRFSAESRGMADAGVDGLAKLTDLDDSRR